MANVVRDGETTVTTGYLDRLSKDFDAGADAMMTAMQEALKKMQADPSNPALLADYQAKMSEYTLFRNAQTNSVKAFKDASAAIIQNFR